MKFLGAAFFASILLAAATGVTAQTNREDSYEARRERLELLNKSQPEKPGTKPQRPSKEEVRKFKAAIAISDELKAAHKDMLAVKGTGIFRLHNNNNCEVGAEIRVDGDCEGFVPGTWAYTLRTDRHGDVFFNDISYRQGYIISNAFLSQALITELGDVPLMDVTAESPGVKFLADYAFATTVADAKQEYEKLKNGIKDGNFIYSKAALAAPNKTFAARIVAYRAVDKKFPREVTNQNEYNVKVVEQDKRRDILVAFRIVEKLPDGSIAIVWRMLREEKSPELVFQKDEEITDLRDK